jgi:hypothetical protein
LEPLCSEELEGGMKTSALIDILRKLKHGFLGRRGGCLYSGHIEKLLGRNIGYLWIKPMETSP